MPHSARAVVASAVELAAKQYPHIQPVTAPLDSLSPQDAALAHAILKLTLRRWMTLVYLVNRYLRKPLRTLEPALQGILLPACAQLLFMDRLPHYAVLHESVQLARDGIRPGAGGLVNAVLRRLSALVDQAQPDESWTPHADRLPLEQGTRWLREPCLPGTEDWVDHLSIATSHPRAMIRRWVDRFGASQALTLCRHGTLTPPIIVSTERDGRESAGEAEVDCLEPHADPGFAVWRGGARGLEGYLAGHPARRVQDPGTAKAVGATARLKPNRILDYCAGKGTKTRQLSVLHPQAKILATDPQPKAFQILRQSWPSHPRVSVVELSELDDVDGPMMGGVDLLVLDVPCSNTGTLSRRPEDRYRLGRSSLDSLVRVQREIIDRSMQYAEAEGYVLYSTCSLEEEENQSQVAWMTRRHGLVLVDEKLTLPAGFDTSYQDGGYFALLRVGSAR